MKKYITLAIAASVLLVFLGEAGAQPSFPIYSVKFVCGLQTIASSQSRPPAEPPVKPGNYATLINIHNFHSTSTGAPVTVLKKAVLSIPEKQLPHPSPTSPFIKESLAPNQAVDVDCTEIVRLLSMITPPPPLPTFITGFVEIQSVSGPPLSVTAVYTSQTCTNPAPGTAPCSRLGELDMEVVPQPAFAGP